MFGNLLILVGQVHDLSFPAYERRIFQQPARTRRFQVPAARAQHRPQQQETPSPYCHRPLTIHPRPTLMVQKESMGFVKAGALKLLPPGSAVQIEIGDGAVAVCNVDGTLHAIDGICPHSGGPLGHGALDGPIITCPYHAWEFDCRTGASEADEYLRLATYPVKVEDGEILVELP